MKVENDFSKPLRDSINQAFVEVLGESNSKVFLEYFTAHHSIQMEKIDSQLVEFSSALSSLGTGGQVLGRTIAKRLFAKLGLEYEEDLNKTFLDYIQTAMESERP
ncbi:MAG TPA: hypothetical protein VK503_03785 [Candidatus Bathyarchaeia archaeon]|nr:hypothetical protein [Candidatus Bathyarchaeia archaeon]